MQSDRERIEPTDPGPPLGAPELSRETHNELRALARLLIGDDHLAEDVVQDAWIVALQRRSSPVRDFRRWLRAVVRRTAIDQRRTRRRRAVLLEGFARTERTPDVSSGDDATHALELVRDAILQLDEPYKRVIELRFLEDCSIDEIASKLDRRASTVRSQITRGVAELRAALDRAHGDRSRWSAALWVLTALPPADRVPVARTASAASPLVVLGACVPLVLGLAWFATRGLARSDAEPLVATSAHVSSPEPVADENADAPRGTDRQAASATVEVARDELAPPPPATHRIVVDVVRADGGPAADVSIVVGRVITRQRTVSSPRSPVTIELARSDLDRVDGVEAVHVTARAAGEAESSMAAVLMTEVTRHVTLTTRGPGQSFDVRVEDESGARVPGARITVGPAGRSGRTEPAPGVYLTDRTAAIETDARGECAFEHVPRTRRTVRAMHPDFADGVEDVVVDDALTELRFVLARGATLRGRVTRPDGSPAAGVQARVEDWKRFLLSGDVRSATTDADGRFVLRGLAPRVAIHVFVEDRADPELFAASIATPDVEEASEEGPAEIELQLVPQPGIALRILDEQRAPLARRRVNLFTAQGAALVLFALTDADGLARFSHVPPIPLDVMVERGLGDTVIVARAVRSGVDVQEVTCPAAAAGRGGMFGSIVGFDGRPIAGAQVLGWRDGELFRVDLDARDGGFRAEGLVPGTFDLHVTTPSNGAYHVGELRVAASGSADLGQRRLPAPVLVELAWGASKPSKDAAWRVMFAPEDKGQRAIESGLLTDARQSLELLPGTYFLLPRDGSMLGAEAPRFTVPPGASRFRFEADAR